MNTESLTLALTLYRLRHQEEQRLPLMPFVLSLRLEPVLRTMWSCAPFPSSCKEPSLGLGEEGPLKAGCSFLRSHRASLGLAQDGLRICLGLPKCLGPTLIQGSAEEVFLGGTWTVYVLSVHRGRQWQRPPQGLF
jgi:hypothetical protein